MKIFVGGSILAATMLTAVMPANAVPKMAAPETQSIVENVRANCAWVDNKWSYRRGDKVIVCRPDRPRGRGWGWHREGNRMGWYHNGRREWNNRNW